MSTRKLNRVATIVVMIAIFSGCYDDSQPTALSSSDSGEQPTSSRPNVVWILLDALRAENLHTYGYERQTTPAIDRLANDGVVFEHAYTQFNQTYRSVPQYLTGRYYPVVGFGGFVSWHLLWKEQPEGEEYISSILGDNGYDTVIVAAHPYFLPRTRIFDSFDVSYFVWKGEAEAETAVDIGAYFRQPPTMSDINEQFLDWLDNRRSPEPFFAYLHAVDTHFPHYLESPYDKWLIKNYPRAEELASGKLQNKPDMYSQEDRDYLRGLYDGSLLRADSAIGELISSLDARGLKDNTIFIIHSDHGELLGEDGTLLGHPHAESFEQICRIPLIISGPGVKSGKRVSHHVQSVDIVPTIVELLNLHTGAKFDGADLTAYLLGKSGDPLHQFVPTLYYAEPDGETWSIRNHQKVFIYKPETGLVDVFRAPYRFGAVETAAVSGLERSQLEEFVATALEPTRASFEQITPDDPMPFSVLIPWQDRETSIVPKENYVDATHATKHWTDGKWAIGERYIAAAPFLEEVGPVTISFHGLPDGEFEVFINLQSHRRPDLDRFVGSSFSIRAQDDEEFKLIGFESNRKELRAVSCGVYSINNGQFTITLAPGDPERYSYGTTFSFVPTSKNFSGERRTEYESQLEALGYL